MRFVFVNLVCAVVARATPELNARWIALALFDAWFATELTLQWRSGSSPESEEDYHSRAFLTAARDASILLPVWLASHPGAIARYEGLRNWGVAVFMIGFAFRIAAMCALGRNFTMSLTGQPDHVLLTRGVY